MVLCRGIPIPQPFHIGLVKREKFHRGLEFLEQEYIFALPGEQ